MLPRILSSSDTEDDRRRWKIVRLDSGRDVPGLILEANADTGHAVTRTFFAADPGQPVAHEDKKHEFGPNGFAIVARMVAIAMLIAATLSACAGITPPAQPTPASINATVQQLATISADPVTAWQAGDFAVRSACDTYLNALAQRQANFGLASGAVGTSGLAAAGFAATRANPVAAALATSASTLVQTFLGQFENAGALPYSPETTALIQNAMDTYEGAVRPPQSVAEAGGDAEGLWWLCSPAGYAELAAKAVGSAQVSAATVPETAFMQPTSAGRPRVFVNGR